MSTEVELEDAGAATLEDGRVSIVAVIVPWSEDCVLPRDSKVVDVGVSVPVEDGGPEGIVIEDAATKEEA